MIVSEERIAAALPGYVVGGQLGAGGFGLVVAGWHRRLHRDVAIKVIPAGTTGGGRGFLAEAELLASLDHPHIVRIYDCLEVDGLDFIVMELLSGGTLAARREALGQRGACAVGLAVAAALGHAHDRGVLHRDIKPSNILFDDVGTAKVADFGIARMFTGSGVSGGGLGAGTPGYMAPEQIVGGRLSPATDLYSLGVVLYELLTGAPPFDSALPPHALWARQLTHPPRSLPAEVPRRVADVVVRMLAKNPADRFEDATTAALELAAAALASYGPNWQAKSALYLHLDDSDHRPAALPPPAMAPDPLTGTRHTAARGSIDMPPASTVARRAGRRRRGRRRVGRRRLVLGAAVFMVLAGVLPLALLPGGDGPRLQAVIRGEVLGFSPNGKLTALSGWYDTTTLWDTATLGTAASPVAILGHDSGGPVLFSPDGTLLATTASDGSFLLWNVIARNTAVDQPFTTFTDPNDLIQMVSFSPDGSLLATTDLDDSVLLWDTERQGTAAKPAAIFSANDDHIGASIAYSPGWKLLATGNGDGRVRLWDTASRGTPQPMATIPSTPSDDQTDTADNTTPIVIIEATAAISPNGKMLATRSGHTARLWDITDPRRPQPLATLTNQAEDLSFSPDGNSLATINTNHTIQLWDTTGRTKIQPVATLTGHTGDIWDTQFSPDGRFLATTSADHTTRLWNTAKRGTVRPILTLTGHTANASNIGPDTVAMFSPNGKLLVTGEADGTTRLWKTTSHGDIKPVATLTNSPGPIQFSPDSSLLTIATQDGKTRIWNTSATQ
ncbi:serine/threonine protein kinase [Frankia sp. AgB1.9]|uniref:WD40 repeat domain-containing serine/threonine protein kinase n=1 Tax=unclassified Frankia TaxID=2632575 RepID=UPI0019318956|nr:MULTISPECIES: serine/threonine-protein kinase [unclassified Frankia]MBL7487968.1 serine/threonine protein kinase [Frankia sp. AgW1.1]MBL7550411.1 serine/threonine protein kinase [Frankia sp. AgB1.9]MBL7620881.1 serine/threonine protein kinase [Frankia sp. AgB1.8]